MDLVSLDCGGSGTALQRLMSKSALRVQEALASAGLSARVVELPQSTRTAADAAKAIGCEVGQIAKSLVFRTSSGNAVLVIASGTNRVNEAAIASAIGEPIGKADAEFVRERTGFAIGGVPPVGHIDAIRTFIDEDLLRFDRIWAAAGTPNAVFELESRELVPLTGGKVIRVT
jgi:prolyl-tRNA editing enzyme YbaK/EbsC (Cys-tRNA(Pro) deacylase)